MTGIQTRIDVDDAAVRAELDRLGAAGADLSPAMDEIGNAMVAATQLRFERGAGPGGIAWPPSIRVQMEGGQTLLKSGRLAASFSHVFGPNFAAWGTNVIYAAVHQFGATISARAAPFLTFNIPGVGFRRKKQVTIPPRPFLGIDGDDRTEIAAILADHVMGVAQ